MSVREEDAEAALGLPRQIICLAVGTVAVLIAGLQPLILGGWGHEGRLSGVGIGLAAMGELFALGLAVSLAATFLKPTAMRIKIALACLGHAAATVAGLRLTSYGLVLDRSIAGLFEGVMLWSAISMIVRSGSAERWAGVFATAQTLAQLAVAASLAAWVIPPFGVNGGLIVLTVLSIIAGLAALFGPDRMAPLHRAEKGPGGPLASRPTAGLVAIFLSLAFIVSLWVYLDPLAQRAGLSSETAGLVVALALAAQVAGGMTATVIGPRWRAGPILIGVAALQALALAGIGSPPSPLVFAGAVVLFGFLWMFALPLQTALMIELDPTRRAALQIGAAQLLGSSFGPLVAGLIVGEGAVSKVFPASAGFLALSTILFVIVQAVMPPRRTERR